MEEVQEFDCVARNFAASFLNEEQYKLGPTFWRFIVLAEVGELNSFSEGCFNGGIFIAVSHHFWGISRNGPLELELEPIGSSKGYAKYHLEGYRHSLFSTFSRIGRN